MSISILGTSCSSFHFVGILGSGMSALAQFVRWEGYAVSGSDRSLGSDVTARTAAILTEMGCTVSAQDGSGLAPTTDIVVVSTAIEADNPDIREATRRHLPVVHRSDVLAALVTRYHTIAVAGTSGKSTVAALCFDCLEQCGLAPSIIGGANLLSLTNRQAVGNAWHGSSKLLVIEADESDGTLVKYHPHTGVFLNVSKDHKPVDETQELFRTLASQCTDVIINSDDLRCRALPHQVSFGLESGDYQPDSTQRLSPDIGFRFREVAFSSPLPGAHNLSNIMAAVAVCTRLGCDAAPLAEALRSAGRLERRFNRYHTEAGVMVVDDFAHNPAKIAAALQAARGMGKRLIAVFQPHGYGPLRFMRDELVETFATLLRSRDQLLMLPVYYAGGTAQRDISSADLATELRRRGINAEAPRDRESCTAAIAAATTAGDIVLSMGARDPSLPHLARSLAAAIDAAAHNG